MNANDFFDMDIFAQKNGIRLIEIKKGYAKTELKVTNEHLNAGHRTQGGAIFTLADLALAAACNSHGNLSFSLSSNITFVRASGAGDTLQAVARERFLGKSTGCYQIDITNQHGDLIAIFESSIFRTDKKNPFTL